mgnify:CR=1 FL=1
MSKQWSTDTVVGVASITSSWTSPDCLLTSLSALRQKSSLSGIDCILTTSSSKVTS